jgi:hypothetical protein
VFISQAGHLLAPKCTGGFLADFWQSADVEVGGSPELQQTLRFGLFHTLQAGACAERSAIRAKGLTGRGYDGHAFWDMDTARSTRRTLPPSIGRTPI